jgi:hypothetical protein
MIKKSNIECGNLNKLIRLLEIDSNDLKTIITDKKPTIKQEYLTDGPRDYMSGLYGVVSINDIIK